MGIQQIFHFGLFHIVQAYADKQHSWKQRSHSRVQRFGTSAFKAFVLFGFQSDLAALWLLFTGLDPFQAVVLFMLFISAAATFFSFFPPKSPHRWESLAWANTEPLECSHQWGKWKEDLRVLVTAQATFSPIDKSRLQVFQCKWFGIKWATHLSSWSTQNIVWVHFISVLCSTNRSHDDDSWQMCLVNLLFMLLLNCQTSFFFLLKV